MADKATDDHQGMIDLPEVGSVITKIGGQWRVTKIIKEEFGKAIPVYRIFLTSTKK
jgi:hypothetical protein